MTTRTPVINSLRSLAMPAIRPVASIAIIAAAMCALLTSLSACAASSGDARRPARHLRIINATYDSVIALAFAPARSSVFQDTALAPPLQGGLTAITVDVPAGGCLRDVRVTFLDGRASMYPNIDVCRYDGLRLTSRRSHEHAGD